MKKLLLIIILTLSFPNSINADDIKEFTIEGMSVGDSLLDYYSEKTIQSAYQNPSYYKDQVFAVIFINKYSENYNRIQVTLKPNDKSHKIYGIDGVIDFDKKINKCFKQKEIIIQDLQETISNYERVDDDGVYEADLSKNSFHNGTWFFLDSGGYFSVSCTEMGNEVRKKNGWTDELSVSVINEELENFLRYNAYN